LELARQIKRGPEKIGFGLSKTPPGGATRFLSAPGVFLGGRLRMAAGLFPRGSTTVGVLRAGGGFKRGGGRERFTSRGWRKKTTKKNNVRPTGGGRFPRDKNSNLPWGGLGVLLGGGPPEKRWGLKGGGRRRGKTLGFGAGKGLLFREPKIEGGGPGVFFNRGGKNRRGGIGDLTGGGVEPGNKR